MGCCFRKQEQDEEQTRLLGESEPETSPEPERRSEPKKHEPIIPTERTKLLADQQPGAPSETKQYTEPKTPPLARIPTSPKATSRTPKEKPVDHTLPIPADLNLRGKLSDKDKEITKEKSTDHITDKEKLTDNKPWQTPAPAPKDKPTNHTLISIGTPRDHTPEDKLADPTPIPRELTENITDKEKLTDDKPWESPAPTPKDKPTKHTLISIGTPTDHIPEEKPADPTPEIKPTPIPREKPTEKEKLTDNITDNKPWETPSPTPKDKPTNHTLISIGTPTDHAPKEKPADPTPKIKPMPIPREKPTVDNTLRKIPTDPTPKEKPTPIPREKPIDPNPKEKPTPTPREKQSNRTPSDLLIDHAHQEKPTPPPVAPRPKPVKQPTEQKPEHKPERQPITSNQDFKSKMENLFGGQHPPLFPGRPIPGAGRGGTLPIPGRGGKLPIPGSLTMNGRGLTQSGGASSNSHQFEDPTFISEPPHPSNLTPLTANRPKGPKGRRLPTKYS